MSSRVVPNGYRQMLEDTSPTAKKSNPVLLTLMMTAMLAGAMLTGASLNGTGGVSLPDLLRRTGFGRDTELMAEQHRQALELQKVELALSRARADVAQLNARLDEAENLYQEAVNAVPATPAEGSNSGAPQGSGHDFDLGALRSSFDEHVEHNRNAFRAVNKRLDWMEKLIYGPERAVQPAGTRRALHRQFAQGWRVVQAENGIAVISSKGGVMDVTPGSSVPELGRIAAIRQGRGGRWVVVTENGTTIRER
jgi:hypothetical protein